jgi:hypothetical protein
MARKIERFVGGPLGSPHKLVEKLGKLSEREIVIMCCSIIDTTLADLVVSGLCDDPGEVDDFLGLDKDARAPLGSFGACIQAAYLIGLIQKDQQIVLKCLKQIRNAFAHPVSVSFRDAVAVNPIMRICEVFRKEHPKQRKNSTYTTAEEFYANISRKLAASCLHRPPYWRGDDGNKDPSRKLPEKAGG